ncbi:MAG: type II toxin-antitoxin system HipA family toxin, partial [Spirochaetales bacterium]|nr:type II toxin-antitoxin system HipA family toxin [Spirochaetales bacterium]
MRCLYCRQEIDQNSLEEIQYLWHQKCCQKFFDVDDFPKIDISKQQLDEYVNQNIRLGLTIPGVQKKLSLHLLRDVRSR